METLSKSAKLATAIAGKLEASNVKAISAENGVVKLLYKGTQRYRLLTVPVDQLKGFDNFIGYCKSTIEEDRDMKNYVAELTDEQHKAMDTAEKILKAVAKKIQEKMNKSYTPFVRHVASSEYGFIELALRPQGGQQGHETATAYSEAYFISATQDNIQDKAKRIFNDFKVLFGGI